MKTQKSDGGRWKTQQEVDECESEKQKEKKINVD